MERGPSARILWSPEGANFLSPGQRPGFGVRAADTGNAWETDTAATIRTFTLGSRVPAGKARAVEAREPLLADRLARVGHEPQVKGDVVQAEERRPQHLVGREQVVQVRP